MRGTAGGASVALSLLAAGCGQLDTMYLRNGIGTDLNSPELVEATRLQEIYVGEICRQAGLRVSQQGDALYCDELNMKPAEWATFVQAGMNDIDRRCDAYLAWLDNKRRWREPILKQFNITAAATAAILGLTKVGPTPIAVVGTAFGLAQDTFTNISTRLVTEVNHSVVQSVVLDNQNQFRIKLANVPIENRPAAIYLLRSYLRICTPFSIEMSINDTVATYHRAGPDALRSDPMATRAPTVARVEALAPRQKIGRPVRVVNLPTILGYEKIIENYDPKVHSVSKVDPVLKKLCVPRAARLVIGDRTKLLIEIYQLATNAKVTGMLTRAQLRKINNLSDCEAGQMNYYEAHVMKNGLQGAIKDFNQGLEANRKLAPGASEVEIRSRIPELRSKFAGKLKIQSPLLANQITSDLIGELRKHNL